MNISDYTALDIVGVKLKSNDTYLTIYQFKALLRANSIDEAADPLIAIESAAAEPVYKTIAPVLQPGQFAEWDGVEHVDGRWVQKWKIVSDPVRQQQDNAFKLAELRRKRNEMLAASDWIHGGDSPVTQASKDQWALYRQQLRDITKQPIDNIVWPIPPVVETAP